MRDRNYTWVRVSAFTVFGLILTVACVLLGGDISNLTFLQWGSILGGTFGVSRIISRETVAEPICGASRHLCLDELITCPRCLGVWAALFLIVGSVLFPAQFLLICGLFTVSGLNILGQEVMGILVRVTDTLDMVNIPYTSHPEYEGESKVRINRDTGE